LFSPQSIGNLSPTVVLTIKESLVQRPYSSGGDKLNSSKSIRNLISLWFYDFMILWFYHNVMTTKLIDRPNLNWQTSGAFWMVTWHVLVPFSPDGYEGFTNKVSLLDVFPEHVNLKVQQTRPLLAQEPEDVPWRDRQSASVRHVPASPVSVLHGLFCNRIELNIFGSAAGLQNWRLLPFVWILSSILANNNTNSGIYLQFI
jgi:hypothetical protein